jgi:hypothetical protein
MAYDVVNSEERDNVRKLNKEDKIMKEHIKESLPEFPEVLILYNHMRIMITRNLMVQQQQTNGTIAILL